jgi:bifunctional non-homologous end joining protein LigD
MDGVGGRPETGPLARYRQKRGASRTPEPFGAVHPESTAGGGGRFVVQKHAARRLHYDFRLELGGVLKSWAVPQGPSADPADRRLAVAVEDHPVEYADFEGVIPKGEYGAGPVIVWDRGAWRPLEDPEEGLRRGKLLFTLHGYKLRGEWTLVRTRRDPKEWLLIKHRDAHADPGRTRPPGEGSVLSGLALEELRDGSARAAAIEAELERLGAPRRPVDLERVRPMLAEPGAEPFSDPAWIFELKWDGWRALAAREGREARIRYRSGASAEGAWPEIERALQALPFERFLIDGEIVVLDEEGKPSFARLSRRARLRRPEAERAAVAEPGTLVAFDLLAFGPFDLRPLPLSARKELLRRMLPREGPLRWADHVEGEGEAFFRAVREQGLEGVVAKRADAPYREGRSPLWRKVRAERTGDFAVVGYTAPGSAARAGLGALHLAAHDGRGLRYAGSVGTGFTDRELGDLRARLEPRRRRDPPCSGPVPAGRGNVWVEPELCVEVRYLERTEEGLLRHPAFVRLREDKKPEECPWEGEEPGEAAPASPSPLPSPPAGERGSEHGGTHPPAKGGRELGDTPPLPRSAGERAGVRGSSTPAPAVPPAEDQPVLTNLDKVFFPEDGLTKGDLLAWYRLAAPWMLPWLRDRPLVLTRFPDGIHGKSFFQKDAPAWTPAWVRRVRVWSEERGAEVDHFVCDDARTLLHLANMGTIPIHVWASRAPELGRPDWCVLDLDPKDAPFRHVVEIALALRRLCRSIGLPCHPKTTGQSGLHLLLPLGGQLTHEQARQLAGLLGRLVAEELPEIATLVRTPSARGGRVYVDTLQNGQGKTIAAPYCVRPRPGAPVSAPLRWAEVGPALDPASFTIRTMPGRLARMRRDPALAVLGEKPDILGALEKLRRRIGE